MIPIAGKPIVQRLVEDIVKICGDAVEEIAFVIGDFGAQVEKDLVEIAENLGAKGSIYYQDQPLGTAHAILCAKEALDGETVIAFADTLFKADFTLDPDSDGVIWVKQVDDPSAFGVVEIDEAGHINNFVEKPTSFVSDLAIIGIYYMKDGKALRSELQYLIDNDIKEKGEYQLTNALEALKQKGAKIKPGTVDAWMDCGNKDVTVDTNKRVLHYLNGEAELRGQNISLENSEIIEPCFIGDNVVLKNSKVGPGVSVGNNTIIENAEIVNTIIQGDSEVKDIALDNSMIGAKAYVSGKFKSLSVGDFCRLED